MTYPRDDEEEDLLVGEESLLYPNDGLPPIRPPSYLHNQYTRSVEGGERYVDADLADRLPQYGMLYGPEAAAMQEAAVQAGGNGERRGRNRSALTRSTHSRSSFRPSCSQTFCRAWPTTWLPPAPRASWTAPPRPWSITAKDARRRGRSRPPAARAER